MISRNLTLRLIIAAIFIPLLIYIFQLGGVVFLIFVELLIILGLWEFFALLDLQLAAWHKLLLIMVGAALPPAHLYCNADYLLGTVLALTFIATLPHVFSRNLGRIGRTMAFSLFGIVYIAYTASALALIRSGGIVAEHLAGGFVIFLFALIWIVDTAAYLFGYLIGGAKLSSVASPNKTIAGFLGGFVGAIIAAAIFNFLFLAEVGFSRLLLPAMLMALFGQLGDLVESIFKREMGKKDSSTLIPGHGGILDRFDSLFFAAPSLYLYLKFIF